MAQLMPLRALKTPWALPLAFTLLFGVPASAAERPYEIGGAQQEIGHVRALAEQLSKQNLLYQLHLGNQSKQDLHDTSAELDRVLELLRKGSAVYSIAAPPNPAIRSQIEKVDEAWGPVRRMATSSPYDYLRRANEFVPRRSRLGDPLFIHSFDRMTRKLIAEADALMALYQTECAKTGYEQCAFAATHGIPIMLTERLVKELVFLYTGTDDEDGAERLRKTRDAMEAYVADVSNMPVFIEATDPARGDSAAFLSGLWGSLEEDWSRLRREVDLAIAGRADEIELENVLKIQARLVEEWERGAAAMVRFVNAKYAE